MFEWLFKKEDDIGEPPYQRGLLNLLEEKEYPQYLSKMYKYITNKKLNLKNPKTFSEKIQWLKLYDSTPIKTQLTDKVLVRDYVKEIIGEEYLKPVLQVCKSFDELDFDKFPNCFIVKANNGCKWHYKVKNKEEVLKNAALMKIMKSHFDGWMNDSFFYFSAFELQYKDIKPQIIVEPLLLDNPNDKPTEIEVYCFNGKAKIIQKIKYTEPRIVTVYDENLDFINLKFVKSYVLENQVANESVKQAIKLSEKLAKDFKLARVDWLLYHDKIYFNEITFTPFSGFYEFEKPEWDVKLGKMLNLK